MRKTFTIVILFAVLSLVLTAGITAAQEHVKIKGTVMKIDAASGSVTIKPAEGDETTIVMDQGDMLSKVKVGDKAEATYVQKEGKNAGFKLRKLVEGCQ